MGAYVALLRGINVSGHRIIKMAELQQVITQLGFLNIKTYLQSGNLIFESELSETSKLEEMISSSILQNFGYEVKVKVISKAEFQHSFSKNPFVSNPDIDVKKLYYIHLMANPDQKVFDELQKDDKFQEQMYMDGELIYVYYINGYGRSKLHGNIIESKLKVGATARNHNTMKRLTAILDQYN